MGSLLFTIQKQVALKLCWAATAASIARFYDPHTTYTQCDIANNVLGRTDCCADISKCDGEAKLQDALGYTGNFKSLAAGLPSFDEIKNQIVNNYVIGLRVNWITNNRGHFIVIAGFHDDQTIDVYDPWPDSNPGRVTLADLQTFYKGVGEITDTYYTKLGTEPFSGTEADSTYR